MEWFLLRGEVVEGPHTEEELRALVESHRLPPDPLVSPHRRDFRPLSEWKIFSAPSATSDPVRHAATQILGAARGPSEMSRGTTVIRGTEEPFFIDVHEERRDAATAVIGSPVAAEISPPMGPRWPGPAQQDPDAGSQRALPERNDEAGPTYFDSVSRNLPLGVAVPSELMAAAGSPELRSPPKGRAVGYVPAPPLPFVKNSVRLLPVVALVGAALVLCALGAFGADRLLNGPTTSNISRYLPAGAPFYLEVPSIKRLSRGLGRIQFLQTENFTVEEVLDSVTKATNQSEPSLAARKRLLAAVDSFAVAKIDGETLYALHFESDDGMTEYQGALPGKPKPTKWGPRYLTPGHIECLWVEKDHVEICGTGAALESALPVLALRAPSAEDDVYLNAAKKRSFWSYLPFFDVPVAYAVGNQAHFGEDSLFHQLEGAIVTANLDERGYIEKVDLLFQQGKAPRSFASVAPLTLWRDLPEGTLLYANFHARFPKNSQEFDEEISAALGLQEGESSVNRALDRVKDTLGFHPAELSKGFAPEGAIFVTFAPEDSLTEREDEQWRGAFWLLQTIDDHAQVRRTLNALVERFSEDRSTLFWKDEHNLVGKDPAGVGIHLRLEKGLIRLGFGHVRELSRVLSAPPLLMEDPAHEASLVDFDQETSALGWLDLGRLLSEPTIEGHFPHTEKKSIEKLRLSLRLTGATRPVSAWSVRQFETGDVRIRSRNFPTAFLLLALSELGVRERPEEHAPEEIGPGPDGSFRLPPL